MNPTDYTILIVDDEADILELLSYNLQKEGYNLFIAKNGDEALRINRESNPDLILLDIMMPGKDGIEVCQSIRSNDINKDVLIVFLSARSESFTQIAALDAGGDDYITKPVKPNILKSKIASVLRRHPKHISSSSQDDKINFGSLSINPNNYSITLNGEEMVLPKKEFDLLLLLSSDSGRVFKRKEILNKVWGTDVMVGDRTIDVHIRKLREKIGNDLIQTLKGVGYKFNHE